MKTYLCLLLVAFLCVDWAQTNKLPRICELDDKDHDFLITCVKEKSETEVMTKLTAVMKALHCGEDMKCGIKKACTEFQGSLVKVGQGIFLNEDVLKIRELFTSCLDKQ
ncbi:hypothetical protein MRX96_000542 [Rhipicephalus microplus]|uniref:Putative microplusin n=1 Tax=Rhipicephalus microplus TaxID=6941 RepID=A0A6M2D5H0_RHIMP|nr:uncharacterized protein LOC119161708 [Rhipicephalus microplus]